MAIESYIHGVGNHHDPRTLKHFISRNRRSYTREMKIFDNYHLQWQLPSLLHKIENNSRNLSRILSGILNRHKIFQCGKQMRNMYSMEAQRLENTKKKTSQAEEQRRCVQAHNRESQRVGNAVSGGVSARLGHDPTTAGSSIVSNNLPL